MKKILVIDDDRHMRSACQRVLERAGWSVVTAETADAGWAILHQDATGIDCVLMDRLMPGRMSCPETLARIHRRAPELPVVIMTGSATEDAVHEVLHAGARGCLAKPFTPEELRDAVSRAAGEPAPLEP